MVMIISFHQGIDDAIGMLMALSCEMEIDHGGVQGIVAEVFLDSTDVDAGLKEMSGIAVPECVNGDSFCEFELFKNASQSPLNGGIAHWLLCTGTLIASPSEPRKDPFGVSMGSPVLTQDIEGGVWQRDITVFSALAPVDMNTVAF
jgi:hypothetical protein